MSDAKVCVDYNSNMNCDSEEPYAMTDAKGLFEIQDADAQKAQLSPLLAEMNSDTVNEATGINLDAHIKLTAPAGCRQLNFLTTMTQYFVGTNSTLEEALAENKKQRHNKARYL